MKLSKKLLILIPTIIIGLDLITKILAYNTLPFNEDVYIIGDKISLYSTYNTGSSGQQIDYSISKTGLEKNTLIFYSTINIILLSIYIFFIYRLQSTQKKKWLLLIPLFIINIIALSIFTKLYSHISFSNHFISWFSKVGPIALLGILIYIIKDFWLKIFFYCILIAGFGNLINNFYPPYHIIDFININGSYELVKIGVFNIADAVIYLSLISIVIYSLSNSIKKSLGIKKK